jgi:hypothetical protein
MCSHGRRRERERDDVAIGGRSGPSPEMRASDEDRERVVWMLREHSAAGRLSTEELEERTAAALGARTHGELDGLTADLPKMRDPRRTEARRAAAQREFADHLRTYLTVMALLVAIWALTGMGYFWPVWPALGWGIGILSHRASVPRGRHAPRTIGSA